MKRLLAALALLAAFGLGGIAPAQAAGPNSICYTTDNTNCIPVSPTNPFPVAATASLAGFQPAATGTPISATTGGATGSLPAGAVVAAFNVGTTNTAYCKLGASATTNDIAIPPQSWFAYTVGAATQMTCITSTSTTTVNLVGGSGLPTGAGGGGGGGSGGTVNQGTGGASAWLVTGTGGTFPSTQSGTWNINNVSGTVSLPTGAATSANQSTEIGSLATIATNSGTQATAANQTSIIGTKAAGTAATNSALVGGVFNSALPSLTNGQQAALQTDSSGRLIVNVGAGGGSGGTSSSYGSAFPSTGTAIGLTDGTNMIALSGTTTNGAYTQAKSGAFVDGSIATIGTQADAAYAGSGSSSVVAALKGIYASVNGAIAAGTNIIGKVGIDQTTPGTTNNVSVSYGSAAVVDNPCQTVAKNYTPISITSSTTSRIIAPTSAKKTYICSFSIQTASANNVAVLEGTGGTCATATAGVYGGNTAALGLNLAANEGIALGNGSAPIMATAGTNVDFCLSASAATNLAGVVSWVQK